MESKVNYTIVGIFVLVLLTVIVIISLWLSMGLQKRDFKTFLVYMNESVAGLEENAPVKYNGVDVGNVQKIELNLANPQQVILTLKIESQIPITENTEAVLTEQGITGIAYIGLSGGNHSPLLTTKPGQEYPVIKSAPSFLVRLDTTLQKLTKNIDSLTVNIKQLLSQENLSSFQNSLQNIEKITETVADNNKAIDSSFKNLEITLFNTAKVSKDLPDMVKEIKESTRSLLRMSQNITQTSQSIDATFKHGDTAIEAITQQLMPQAYDTIDNMKTITSNLLTLSKKLKNNPALLLHGQSPSKPGPGE